MGLVKMHDILLNKEGELGKVAQRIPEIREYIEDLPKTAATFAVADIDTFTRDVQDEHLEFVGSWRVPDSYSMKSSTSRRRYVNPNYAHVHTYTDAIVKCECGAEFTMNYEKENSNLRVEHEHEDDCMPYYRLEARAAMSRYRHEMLTRLSALGWRGKDIVKRLGMSKSAVGNLCRQFGTDMEELRDVYRKEAGNTYAHLVRTHNVSPTLVSEIYGHRQSTMTRWAKDYADYKTERGRNQFTRNEKGQFTWQTIGGESDD